jgi:hypothetical protein
MMATYQMLFSDGDSEEGRENFNKVLTIYEKELNRRMPNGPYFGGTCICK